MKRFLSFFLLLFIGITTILAQGSVKGKVLDKANDEALGFVSVAVSPKGSTKIAGGSTTDADGNFHINGLKDGSYTMTFTFIGYKTVKREFTISQNQRHRTFTAVYMGEDAHVLNEVQVTGQRSVVKLEVDRKVFDVASNIANVGQTASEVLDNIPSVEVDQDGNVSLRGNAGVEVWINGRSAGLTSDNMGQILQQIPSESIDHIEVMDNPSAKFSAEGSAGIINIVLKKDRKAGYYGSVQAGADTRGGANTGVSFNYSSSKIDLFANVGYRHREDEGKSLSDQTYTEDVGSIKKGYFSRYDTRSSQLGNNLFSRAGFTWHVTEKDDIGFTGMLMHGKHKSWSNTPYRYGYLDANGNEDLSKLMMRSTFNTGPMQMLNGNINYRHSFSDTHFIELNVSGDRWDSDRDDVYRDSTEFFNPAQTTDFNYQSRPMNVKNREYEVKLDYENKISDVFKLGLGYNGNFSKENTPNESFTDNTWEGDNAQPDKNIYNRFIYKNDVHAGYLTANLTLGNFGIQAGLRGEYWTINTESRSWDQDHADANGNILPADHYKKSFFELFPSVFMSYQLTKTQQLQLNYTRRLRRPWGGQLNSFRNTSDASMVSFGNPELTPEYSNSFSLNYLKSWDQHSLLVSAYYRPTTNVMQRVNYRDANSSTMYSTSINVAKSQSSGLELTAKNKLFRLIDLTTNVNAYYYKLDGFEHQIGIDSNGNPTTGGNAVSYQKVTGKGNDNFTWNARMTAAVKLPYDISIQATGRYTARQVISQGHRPAFYMVDLGIRKNFFNRLFTLSINCRDLLNTRQRESFTEGQGYTRYQLNKRGGRKVNFTLTWNFGNGDSKKKRRPNGNEEDDEDMQMGGGYDM